jgi:hypothetical protein
MSSNKSSSIQRPPSDDDDATDKTSTGSDDVVDGIMTSRHSLELARTSPVSPIVGRGGTNLFHKLSSMFWSSEKSQLPQDGQYSGCSQGESGSFESSAPRPGSPVTHIDIMKERLKSGVRYTEELIHNHPFLTAIGCFILGCILAGMVVTIWIQGLGGYLETMNPQGVKPIIDAVASSALDDDFLFPSVNTSPNLKAASQAVESPSHQGLEDRLKLLESQTRGCNALILHQEAQTKKLMKEWNDSGTKLLNEITAMRKELKDYGSRQIEITGDLRGSLDSLNKILESHLPSSVNK